MWVCWHGEFKESAERVHQSKYEPQKILEKDTNSEISSFILPAWEL